MAQFKKGDRVRIRRDADSQFRGRLGIIQEEPRLGAGILGYIVKVEASGFAPTFQVSEKDLEATDDK